VNALHKCPTPPSPEAIPGDNHHQMKKVKSTDEGKVNQPPNKESLVRETHRLPSRVRENPKPNPPMKDTRSTSASTRGEDNHPHHTTSTRKTKAERKIERLAKPATYPLPKALPHTFIPKVDHKPEAPSHLPSPLSDMEGDDEDSDLAWLTGEDEFPHQALERKDHNAKLAQKKEGCCIEADNQQCCFKNNSLGRIPNNLGVISIDGIHKRLSTF